MLLKISPGLCRFSELTTRSRASVDMIPVLRSWDLSLRKEKKNQASTNLPLPAPPLARYSLRWLVVRTTPNGPELARVEFYQDAAASIESVGRFAGVTDLRANRAAVTARCT